MQEALAFVAALAVGREPAVGAAAASGMSAAVSFSLACVWYTALLLVALLALRQLQGLQRFARKLEQLSASPKVRRLTDMGTPRYVPIVLLMSWVPNSFWLVLAAGVVSTQDRRLRIALAPVAGAVGYMSYHAVFEVGAWAYSAVSPWLFWGVAAALVAALLAMHAAHIAALSRRWRSWWRRRVLRRPREVQPQLT